MSKLLFILSIIAALCLAAIALSNTMKYQALTEAFATHLAEDHANGVREYNEMESIRHKRKCEQLYDGNYTLRPDHVGIWAHYCLTESGFMYMGAAK